ncbi:serpin family protein [Candidatus Poribacteria bacterium]|nr:serpin family protein [Candidatus Poribacteria bacterium]MYF57101.1 serpin family protein [Candidatus Poribacteria bacterium]
MEKPMNSKRTSGKTNLYIMFFSIFLLIGCFDNAVDTLTENIDKPAVVPIDLNVSMANTRFGFDLFQEIWKAEPNQNVFISPFSVSTALTMTLNGASGETEQAITDTLQLQNVGNDAINNSFSQLLQQLQTSDPKVTLTIANSLWANQDFQFKQDFLQRNENYFEAEVSTLDFLDPNTLNTINQWVNTNTNGKIPKILEEIESNAVLFLINAIYFKGVWQTEFDPAKTQDGDFYLTDGSTKQVPMMNRQGMFPIYYGDNVAAINLPYGEGRMRMYIFLPSQKSNLNDFVGVLNAADWENWMTQFREQDISIRIPKFKIEYGTKELNDALTSLGMGVAFDEDRADFSRMATLEKPSANLYIDKVAHKTFIEVNEEGSEAAAATSVTIGVKSLPRMFIVNKPFFFAIRDNETQTVLFMGVVVDP